VRLPAFLRRSVRGKLTALVIATTLLALLVNAAALLYYNLRDYRETQLADVRTQAEILGRASAAAIAFDQREDARRDLASLQARPDIDAAALYTASGALFAAYRRDEEQGVPSRAEPPGHRISGDRLSVFRPIAERGDVIGSVYVRARYGVRERLAAYLGIAALVMALALGAALALSAWLQRAVSAPILEVADAARAVVERRDYAVRAAKSTEDEIGVLAEAFNRMLEEVQSREEALRLADRRKDEFLATLAHELRNPLAPVRNALYLMQAAPDDAEMTKSARAIIERQLAQMVRLVDDLLDVSRITTGKLALRRERAELRAVAQNALEAVEPLIRARGHALHVELPPAGIYVNADATRLTQVFLNLLNNAAKFTDPGGRIEFRLGIVDGEMVARVRDNGIGIAPEMREAIFDMFAQVDRSLERATSGLGVGLSLSRRLAELHGGSLEARSEGLGRGAEFVVRMPVPPGESQAFVSREKSRSGAPVRHRILLADDNQDFALSLASLLRGMGNEVRVEHDGAAALAAAAEFKPEIAFLDIGLPKLNGFELARKLRQLSTPSLLVAVTGWGQPSDRQRAKDAGFDDYMVKPIDIERVASILKGA
jgi:signal transduction histidine kinase/CheY-like chemotaxis protein